MNISLPSSESETVSQGCSNLRQGDVIGLESVWYQDENSLSQIQKPTPHGVVVVSQTCDVIQPTKSRCTIAPLVEPTTEAVGAAMKGRSPLKLYIPPRDEVVVDRVADLEWVASVPKVSLEGLPILHKAPIDTTSEVARNTSFRIGRVYSRFAIPDEVVAIFKPLQKDVRKKSGSPASPLGLVLDKQVESIRVAANQWQSPSRILTVYLILKAEFLIPDDDADPTWVVDRVVGLKSSEQLESLPFERLCDLLNANNDPTTLLKLWDRFRSCFGEKYFNETSFGEEVLSVHVEIVSETEMSLAEWNKTESLDLEVLSDSGELLTD